jgi:translocation and assembly module TamA
MRQIFRAVKTATMAIITCLIAPVVFAEVNISGLEGKVKDNVRLMLALQKEKCTTPEWKVRGLYEKADQEIDQGLRALGYYHGLVKKSLSFTKACWQADFDINSGPRVYVKDVDITIKGEAHDDPEFEKLRNKLLKEIGKPLYQGQ